MRGDHQARPRRGAGAIAEHVAGRIDAHVPQTELLEGLLQDVAARRLLEGGRWHLAEANLILNRLRFVRLGGIDRRSHGCIFQQVRRGRGFFLRAD